MTDISENIEQYLESRRLLKERIDWLTEQIGEARKKNADQIPILLERRHKLYGQLADVEYGLHSLREYLESVEPRTFVRKALGW